MNSPPSHLFYWLPTDSAPMNRISSASRVDSALQPSFQSPVGGRNTCGNKERVFLILLGPENRLSTPVRRVGDRAPPFALFKSTDAIFIAPCISLSREKKVDGPIAKQKKFSGKFEIFGWRKKDKILKDLDDN